MTQIYDYEGIVTVTSSVPLAEEMWLNVQNYFNYLRQRIGRSSCAVDDSIRSHIVELSGEANEMDQRQRFVGFCGLFVFQYRVFRTNIDKNFVKAVYQMHKKVCPRKLTHASVLTQLSACSCP